MSDYLTKNLMEQTFLEKLTVSQLVKKFFTFYGTRRFVNTIKITRYLSSPTTRSVQSTPPSNFL